MKLKNSYVLLMAMAIFLLISIGSVCASEDIATDSDIELESADTDVVLADDGDAGETTAINTTITADGNHKVYKNDDKNITVTVADNNSNPIQNITKGNLTVTENNKNIGFTYNNSIITITDALSVGEHKFIINYLGNANYTKSSTEFNLTIFGDNELKLPSTVEYDGTSVEIPINLTNGVDDNTNLLNDSNTQVILKDGNANITISGINWNDVAASNKLVISQNIANIPATLTITYTEGSRTIVKNIAVKYKSEVTITPTVLNITEGENATFVIAVTGADGTILNITKGNLTISKTGATNKFNETTGVLTLINLTKGVYNVTITYKGNNVYNTAKGNIIINVRGDAVINTNGTSVNVNSTKTGEIQIINITNGVDIYDFSKGNVNISVVYKDGNETKNITITNWDIVNGTIVFTLENGNFTTANLTINYTGSANAVKVVTLNRIYNANVTAINNEAEYQTGNFTYKFIDIDTNEPLANKTVRMTYSVKYSSITFQNSIEAMTDENGIVVFNNSKIFVSYFNLALMVGNNTVTLGGNNLKVTNSSQTVVISKASINITIEDYEEYYGSAKKVKITVINANTGDPVKGSVFHLYMPQTAAKDYYLQTNENGTIEIDVSKLVGGNYDITVNNNDTENINNASDNNTIKILQIPVKIAITSSLTIYYNSGSTATIKITDKATGKPIAGAYVLVQIGKDSKTYLFQTDSKGQISFAASLAVGKHPITVSTADNRYKGTSVSKTITVKKASATIKAPRATDYYKGVKYFTVKLINSKNKKAIYDAKLNIKVYISSNRYYNYNGRTGANGQIKLVLDSLKPGTYKVVVAGADSKSFTAKQVTSKIVIKKAPTKLIPKKLTAKKGAKSYFKVTVKNYKTKKVIKGVKVKIKVYTGKKAKTYTAKTNAKGIAQISTSKLKVGKHKVIVTSANKYCVAKQAKSYIKITR